jgi:Flp pilus assembly pilin Flp
MNAPGVRPASAEQWMPEVGGEEGCPVRKLNALRRQGQGLVEYGLILVLIAVIVAIVLVLVGDRLVSFFSVITSMMPQP